MRYSGSDPSYLQPYHPTLLLYLIWRMSWILPSTNYRKNVATKKHLTVADSTVLKFTPKGFLEWVTIEDAKARVCTP